MLDVVFPEKHLKSISEVNLLSFKKLLRTSVYRNKYKRHSTSAPMLVFLNANVQNKSSLSFYTKEIKSFVVWRQSDTVKYDEIRMRTEMEEKVLHKYSVSEFEDLILNKSISDVKMRPVT